MRPKFNTAITRLFGIEYPIIQGPMAWLSEAKLCAAASNAGGLGVLGASVMSVDEFEVHVKEAVSMTDRPLAVNFPLVLGKYEAHLEMVRKHGIEIIFVSAGSPKLMTGPIKESGAICVHVVPNLKLALKAKEAGVDAIVLESYEAGGHVSEQGITALVNIPNLARHLGLPLIAAGGIVDGRGFAAAMALGADAIQMGTRFLATVESNAHENYKRLLLDAKEGEAVVYSHSFHPGRALHSTVIDRILAMEAEGQSNDEVRKFIGRGRARKAAHEGNLDEGMFYAGAGAGLIEQETTVAELFDQLLSEYAEVVGKLAGTL